MPIKLGIDEQTDNRDFNNFYRHEIAFISFSKHVHGDYLANCLSKHQSKHIFCFLRFDNIYTDLYLFMSLFAEILTWTLCCIQDDLDATGSNSNGKSDPTDDVGGDIMMLLPLNLCYEIVIRTTVLSLVSFLFSDSPSLALSFSLRHLSLTLGLCFLKQP